MDKLLYNKLKERAISTLYAMVFLISIATLVFVATLLTNFDIITIVNMNEKNKSLLLIFTSVFAAGAIICGFIVMMPYFIDYKSIKNKSYIIQNTIVSRFDFHDSGYEPLETHCIPIFEDLKTGKEMTFEIDQEVEIGEQYTIAYLPRTKIAIAQKTAK